MRVKIEYTEASFVNDTAGLGYLMFKQTDKPPPSAMVFSFKIILKTCFSKKALCQRVKAFLVKQYRVSHIKTNRMAIVKYCYKHEQRTYDARNLTFPIRFYHFKTKFYFIDPIFESSQVIESYATTITILFYS